MRVNLSSYKLLLLSLLVISQNKAFADIDYMDQVSVSFGMVNSSYSQNESSFNEGATLANGAVSVISINLNYELFKARQNSHLFKISLSGIAGEVSKYYNLGYARRYYFGSVGTRIIQSDNAVKVKMVPKSRYYLGYDIGTYYMVYETKTEVRSDIGLEAGGHAGFLWSVDSLKSYKAQISIVKGTGVETTSINTQLFFGMSFFIDSLF